VKDQILSGKLFVVVVQNRVVGRDRVGSSAGWLCTTPALVLIAVKTNKKLDVRRQRGDGDWERLFVTLSGDHASSRGSVVIRFDARHVTIFF
jgi:hypothetical protein